MNNETIKCPEVTPEEEIVDLHPPYTTAKSSAKWSEAKQKYFYKPLDREYEKRHYYKHRKEMTCIHCGSVVLAQMCKHLASKKCKMSLNAVQQTMDKYNIEDTK